MSLDGYMLEWKSREYPQDFIGTALRVNNVKGGVVTSHLEQVSKKGANSWKGTIFCLESFRQYFFILLIKTRHIKKLKKSRVT